MNVRRIHIFSALQIPLRPTRSVRLNLGNLFEPSGNWTLPFLLVLNQDIQTLNYYVQPTTLQWIKAFIREELLRNGDRTPRSGLTEFLTHILPNTTSIMRTNTDPFLRKFEGLISCDLGKKKKKKPHTYKQQNMKQSSKEREITVDKENINRKSMVCPGLWKKYIL